ncbi:MAG: replication protein [Bacteroidia bacterium]|nr:replication protein [Bacteroidia bacterium]
MKGDYYYTPVPNRVFSWMAEYKLSGVEIRLLLHIIRCTRGWIQSGGGRKKRDWIAHSQFVKYCSMSDRSVTKGIQSLIDKKLIKATDSVGNDLSIPNKRKFAMRVFYELSVGKSEK